MKRLVREIVLSQTYQQSGTNAAAATADPENRLFARANRRRLEAECIRDTMLVVSGKLSLDRGGPAYPATLAADYGYKGNDNRRSVYLPMFRNALPEALEAFDLADPSMVTGRRNVSTVAPQALFMLNHPFPAGQRVRRGAADGRSPRMMRAALQEPIDGRWDASLRSASAIWH